MGYAVSLQIQQSQKRLIEALKSDFSRKTQFSRFCGIILVEKYTRPSRRWNLFFKHFGDETNIKLLWEAESAIWIKGFLHVFVNFYKPSNFFVIFFYENKSFYQFLIKSI